MGISHRRFLIDQQDRLYRMTNAKFDAMARDPASHCFPQFAGQRVRTASTLVELINRQPTEVVRMTFAIFTFGDGGRFERDPFVRQQSSLAELAMAPVIADRHSDSDVVDAASRFIAHGGDWTPSRTLARAIEDAALGRTRCPQLSNALKLPRKRRRR
jgi:hypothetical protein